MFTSSVLFTQYLQLYPDGTYYDFVRSCFSDVVAAESLVDPDDLADYDCGGISYTQLVAVIDSAPRDVIASLQDAHIVGTL